MADPYTRVLAEWTQQIIMEDRLITERKLRALLQPKPRWMPMRLWRRIIARVVYLEERA